MLPLPLGGRSGKADELGKGWQKGNSCLGSFLFSAKWGSARVIAARLGLPETGEERKAGCQASVSSLVTICSGGTAGLRLYIS